MTRSRGSITVFLCLVLTVILALFSTMLQSAVTAAGRVAIASAVDQGLFSLFAQYDRQLLDNYDLFYLDGGYQSEHLQMETVYRILCRDTDMSLDSYPFSPVKRTSGGITGYTLASDQAGNSFRQQIAGYMTQKLGVTGIQQLFSLLTEQSTQIGERQTRQSQISDQDPVTLYELEKERASSTDTQTDSDPEIVIRPDISENPIETISQIRKKGILYLVLSDPQNLSDASVDPSIFPSNRTLQQGFGIITENAADATDKILMLEYIMEKFPCYTSGHSTGTLQYQIEYILGDKSSDADNLKAVVTQLLAIREACNMVYLYSSPDKKAQADVLAASLAASLMLPVAQPVISLALIACWAFAESILDIRQLLDGNKVPLLKDASSWTLSLDHLAEFTAHLDDTQKTGQKGLDYRQYLRVLLFLKSSDLLTTSAMDLVEYNMNQSFPERIFRIDHCIGQLEFESTWESSSQTYTIQRAYQYLSNT